MKLPALLSTAVLIACSTSPKPAVSQTGGARAAGGSPIPLEDFFRNAQKKAFQISPDGKYISYLAPHQGRMNVFVEPRERVGQDQAIRLTDVTDRDVAGYDWKGSRTILFTRDFGGDENYQIFGVDVETKKVTALTPFPKVRAGILDDLHDVDPNAVLIEINKRNPELFDVYRMDVKSGKLTEVARNPGGVVGWQTDHRGRVRAAVRTDGSKRTLLVRDGDKGKFRALLTTDFRTSVDPLFFTFDNKNVYASSNRGRDKAALVTLDLKTGRESVIFDHPDVDLDQLSYSKKRHVLWAARYDVDKPARHFFDHEIEGIFSDVQKQLPGMEIGIIDQDDAERLFLFVAFGDRTPGAAYLYDAGVKSLTKLADFAPWLPTDRMSEMRPVSYKSRDGLTIHAYLTLPHGRATTHLPVIVNPHGGPWVRDHWGYNPEAQFLASRGYAVLQMNYRGSTGYGRDFWTAGFKQWGRAMQDDVSDGVRWMIDQKIADPKRVGIYGGSYGGYATLAGLAFSPELYACGVDYVGVSNLFTFMKTIPPYWKPMLEQMYEQVGNPNVDVELLRAASPVYHVDRIRAPLFVAQGAKDPRVNINESEQIVDALTKRGVAVEYLVKENEGHGFHNEENRFDFYRKMEAFLRKHLSPDAN